MPNLNSHFTLFWNDSVLTVVPFDERIATALEFYERIIENDDEPSEEELEAAYKEAFANPDNILTIDGEAYLINQPKVERKGSQIVEVLNRPYKRQSSPLGDILETHQGFRERVMAIIKGFGGTYSLFDTRADFIKPNMQAAFGFRFNQAELFNKGLGRNRSGLIVAPTRYGKSHFIKNILRVYKGLATLVIVPGAALLQQLYDELCEALPGRDIKMIGGNSRTQYQSDDITVCSMDSLNRIIPDVIRLVVIDEPHAVSSNTRFIGLNRFYLSRKIGVTATPEGRFDGRDQLLEGVVGPILAERTYKEAVAEGAIAPIVVFVIEVPCDGTTTGMRSNVETKLIQKNDALRAAVAYINDEVIPPEWQTITFVQGVAQVKHLMKHASFKNVKVAMAKLMNTATRQEINSLLRSGELKRALASKILIQGVTFHHLRAVTNARGGGAYTSTIQLPGRVAEVRPDKKCGVLFDFRLVPADKGKKVTKVVRGVLNNCEQRIQLYRKIGYRTFIVKDLSTLKELFNAECL